MVDRKGRKLNARKEERGERARRIFEMVSADLGLICSTFLRQGVTSLGPMSGVGRLVSARDEAAAASMVAASSCLASFLPLKTSSLINLPSLGAGRAANTNGDNDRERRIRSGIRRIRHAGAGTDPGRKRWPARLTPSQESGIAPNGNL